MSNKSPKKNSPTSYSSLPSPVYPMFKKPSIPPTKSGLSLPSPVYPLNNNEKENEKDKLINLEKVVNGDEYNDENVTVLDLVVDYKDTNNKGIDLIIVYYIIGNKKFLIEYRYFSVSANYYNININDLIDYNFYNIDNLKEINAVTNPEYSYYSPIIIDSNYKRFVDIYKRYGKQHDELKFDRTFYNELLHEIYDIYILYLKNVFHKVNSKCLFILKDDGYGSKIDNNFSNRIVFYNKIKINNDNIKNYVIDYSNKNNWWVDSYFATNNKLYGMFIALKQLNSKIKLDDGFNLKQLSINIFSSERLIKLVDTGYKYTDGKGKFYKLD